MDPSLTSIVYIFVFLSADKFLINELRPDVPSLLLRGALLDLHDRYLAIVQKDGSRFLFIVDIKDQK